MAIYVHFQPGKIDIINITDDDNNINNNNSVASIPRTAWLIHVSQNVDSDCVEIPGLLRNTVTSYHGRSRWSAQMFFLFIYKRKTVSLWLREWVKMRKKCNGNMDLLILLSVLFFTGRPSWIWIVSTTVAGLLLLFNKQQQRRTQLLSHAMTA